MKKSLLLLLMSICYVAQGQDATAPNGMVGINNIKNPTDHLDIYGTIRIREIERITRFDPKKHYILRIRVRGGIAKSSSKNFTPPVSSATRENKKNSLKEQTP